MSDIKTIYEKIKYFENINSETYQLLGYLGFIKDQTIKTNSGVWNVYTKKNFVFPHFISELKLPLNKFFAVFKNTKEFIVYGTYDDFEELKENLIQISEIFFKKVKKVLGIPFTLTEENAQDYGYLRGLFLSFLLFVFDLSYPFIFKLKSGIINSFIDYVKVIYYGTPGFGIFVGITVTGLYFIFLFILIPISFGLMYKKIATRKILKKMNKFIENISTYDYNFGIDAEKTLKDEFNLIVEEKRKEQIYNEIKKFVDVSRTDFENIYEKLKTGFLNISEICGFIDEYEAIFKNLPLKKFLEIVEKYTTARFQTDIKFQSDQ
jgi:hypothetical protein